MNIGEKITSLKPYVGGAVIGAAAIAIIGFSAGWVVTAGTMQDSVQQAKVSTLAEVCEQSAEKHWTGQGKKLAALEGWDNEQRSELAKQFAPVVPKDDAFHDDVVDACDDLLEPA